MQQSWTIRKSIMAAVVAFGMVAATTGCATKKFVRTSVDTRAQELSGRMDNQDKTIQGAQGSIEELNGIAREHGQKISTLDTSVKQNEQRTQKAQETGDAAQQAAGKVGNEVTAFEARYQNRNHFITLHEDQVRFALNSAKLDDASKQMLNEMAQQLKDNPDAILVLEGRTDSAGSADYNIQLGQHRAEAVIRYLGVEQGVPVNRISQLSFGKDKPLADNKTKEGRSQNRAVVLRVMGPDPAAAGMMSQSKVEDNTDR